MESCLHKNNKVDVATNIAKNMRENKLETCWEKMNNDEITKKIGRIRVEESRPKEEIDGGY